MRHLPGLFIVASLLLGRPTSVRTERVSSPAETGRLMVRVVDDQTGLILPARIALRTSDGKYPGDRLDCSAKNWPYIEAHGVFLRREETFTLPAGKTVVTAAHGMEYRAETQSVDIEPGKLSNVELRLRRVFDMRKAGWVAGDIHVHMMHGENQRQTSYEDVATTCAANGLDFVCVGQEYVGAGKLDLAGYQAECRKASTESFQMFLGGERPKNLLGHQAILGVPNPFLISDEVPYFPSHRKVHAQKGALVYMHPVRYYPGRQYEGNWLNFPGNNLARELVFDSFLGPSFDGVSVLSDEPDNTTAHNLWFNLLNRGLFVPAFADSDACFDRPVLGIKTPGFWTTYYYVGPGGRVDQDTLTEAVRRGRTIATTGPLLQFQIDGERSGGTILPDGKPHTVAIDTYYTQHAFSLDATDPKTGETVGVAKVELIRNGKVAKTWEPRASTAHLTLEVTEREPCWYAVRVYGTDARWQVALASPIYFAAAPVGAKRTPLEAQVHGRIYDFKTGQERAGTVTLRRGDEVLKRIEARGAFTVVMPLDAEIVVEAPGFRPIAKNLLMDYGPVHRFLWYLESKDMGDPEMLARFEQLVQKVDLEFPLGYKMPGSYIASDLPQSTPFQTVRLLEGPPKPTDGSAAVAAVLMDTDQVLPGDTMHLAAIYRDEGDTSKLGPLVVEARGYDPSRPTAYGALKLCATFEKTWATAVDLGNGYKMISGELKIPTWVASGPTGNIDISIRARQGNGDAAFVGLAVPLGPTRRALSLTSSWPIMPISWPDHQYGIGPFKVCNRIGRESQPKADYRQLHLQVEARGKTLDLLPARDGRGSPDSDDAMYTGHFLDQALNDASHLAKPEVHR